jgi:TonB family protein
MNGKIVLTGIAVVVGMFCFSALAQVQTKLGGLFDPFITKQQVLSIEEFEKVAIESAFKVGVPQDSITAILQEFEGSHPNRIIRSQEGRYYMLSLLYKNGVPYELGMKFLLAFRSFPVDTGFLGHIRSIPGSQDSADSSNPPYVVGSRGVKPPVSIAQPLPSYTSEAREARIEGIVLIKAVVSKDGYVINPVIVAGLGYGLDESAIETLLTKWRFNPGTLDGTPVDVQANIEVAFRLY